LYAPVDVVGRILQVAASKVAGADQAEIHGREQILLLARLAATPVSAEASWPRSRSTTWTAAS
jgi:hypothetical protein